MTEVTQAEGVMRTLWPILGGNHTDAETWAEIAVAAEWERTQAHHAGYERGQRETVARIVAEIRATMCDCSGNFIAGWLEAGEWK